MGRRSNVVAANHTAGPGSPSSHALGQEEENWRSRVIMTPGLHYQDKGEAHSCAPLSGLGQSWLCFSDSKKASKLQSTATGLWCSVCIGGLRNGLLLTYANQGLATDHRDLQTAAQVSSWKVLCPYLPEETSEAHRSEHEAAMLQPDEATQKSRQTELDVL